MKTGEVIAIVTVGVVVVGVGAYVLMRKPTPPAFSPTMGYYPPAGPPPVAPSGGGDSASSVIGAIGGALGGIASNIDWGAIHF